MMVTIGTFIYQFQTLIAGLVGFLGIIFSLIGTAHSARKQSDRQRKNDADGTRAALAAELKVALVAFEREGDPEKLQDNATGSILVPDHSEFPTFNALAPQFYLLRPNDLNTLSEIRARIKTLYFALSIFGGREGSYFVVPVKSERSVREMMLRLCDPIREAVQELQRRSE